MPQRIIGIMSGKGGVGKTVSSLNIGLALHQFGEDVVVIDADITASNLGLHLGMYNFPHGLQDVLTKDIAIEKALYIHHTGLRVIPASLDLSSLRADIKNLRKIISEIPADLVLIDSPPGINEEVIAVMSACREIMVITNPEIPTVTNAMKLSRVAEKQKRHLTGVVVNRYSNNPYELTIPEIEMMIESTIYGVVPEDPYVRESIYQKIPVVAYKPFSPAAIEFKKIAAKIIGKTYKLPRFYKIKSLLGLI